MAPPYTRSEFLRLTTFGALGFATASRSDALPTNYTGIPLGIRPYLQSMRPDSLWVSWLTAAENSGTIEWGTSAGSLSNSIVAATDTTLGTGYRYHSGQITGLSPNTYYFYRVRNGATTSDVFRFRTPKADGTKTGRLRVLVAGDNQLAENRFEKLIACAKSKIEDLYGVPIEEAIDFVLMPGDQVDAGTMDQYRDRHFKFNGLISPVLPIMTTVGNHETYSDTGLANYKKMFRYTDMKYANITSPDPQVYYAYKVGSVCFIHTSSEHTGTTQKNWLRQIVDALKIDSTTDMCVSVVHRPYQAEQYIGDISAWFRNEIMPMLAETEKHVLTIGAHHHLYARGQTRDWPIYHIISGGTAWDQYWGQSTEADYDDVQKTIANWAWQLLDFDLANRTMEVSCYAEANVRFSAETRWTTKAYNSRLIDSFHRKLGLAAPNKPSLTNVFAAPVSHPIVLTSGAYATTTSESLTSTQFQVAADATFTNLKLDRIRDVENVYGDTGAPDYEPVNIHNGLNILQHAVPNTLSNGTYYARVRHRDSNAMWSAWSDVKTFQISGGTSASPKLLMQKAIYAPNEDFSVAFENGPGNAKDWIGIYQKGQTPGSATASTTWFYVNGSRTSGAAGITNGAVNFTTNIANGEWFAAFLQNDGYTEIAPRVPFYVGTQVTLTATKENYAEGESVRIDFSGAPAGATDWIGIYKVDQSPGSATPATSWQYATTASGFKQFSGLTKGYYYAVFMVNDGYQEISTRVRFSVGSLIAQVNMGVPAVAQGDPFTVTFSEGPGIPKDWIGLFKDGDVPGINELTQYLYFNGTTNGQVTFDMPQLPAGRYWVAMFTNDSYTEVSNRYYFDIVPLVFEEARLENGQMRLRWKTVIGETYVVQKNASLSPGTWIDVQTIIGSGANQQVLIPLDISAQRGFYRVVKQD